MKSVVVDKVASVAQHSDLGRELRLSDDIPCEEGVLVAARVLNNKTRYNQLELTSGRMATVNQGDVIVGALGHRNALRGYSGHLPEALAVGDSIQILNIGGVLGICDSANPDVGPAFDCEVLGTVLDFPYLGERIGIPACRRAQTRRQCRVRHARRACCRVGRHLHGLRKNSRRLRNCRSPQAPRTQGRGVQGYRVSLRRDILAMEDAGAKDTMIFSDLGVVTTTADNGPALCRALLTALARDKPDVIILELGDGLIGEYGVEAILSDAAIRDAMTSVVLCANDPVSAWGGARILREAFEIEPDVVTGPATDNAVGVNQIRSRLDLTGINALTNGVALGDLVAGKLERAFSGDFIMSASIPAIVLGGTGYVGGELLRLISTHPNYYLAAAVSESRSGDRIAEVFPHLASMYGERNYVSHNNWFDEVANGSSVAIFSAAPHGASAGIIKAALEAADARDIGTHVVDASADFRYSRQSDYEAVYGIEHGAPELLDRSAAQYPSTPAKSPRRTSATPVASPRPCCLPQFPCSSPVSWMASSL